MLSQAVCRHWPYFGVNAACRPSYAQAPSTTSWTKEGLSLIWAGTWQKALDTVEARALRIGAGHSSPADRAWSWNTYVCSLVHYPANTCGGTTGATHRWNRALSTAFGKTRRIPAEGLSMCGPLGRAQAPGHSRRGHAPAEVAHSSHVGPAGGQPADCPPLAPDGPVGGLRSSRG